MLLRLIKLVTETYSGFDQVTDASSTSQYEAKSQCEKPQVVQ